MKKNIKYFFIKFLLNMNFGSKITFLQKVEQDLLIIIEDNSGNKKKKMDKNHEFCYELVMKKVSELYTFVKEFNKSSQDVDIYNNQPKEYDIEYFKTYFKSITVFNYNELKKKIKYGNELRIALFVGFNIEQNNTNIILNGMSSKEKILLAYEILKEKDNIQCLLFKFELLCEHINKLKLGLSIALDNIQIQKEIFSNDVDEKVEQNHEFYNKKIKISMDIIDHLIEFIENSRKQLNILSKLKNVQEINQLIIQKPQEFCRFFQTYLLFKVCEIKTDHDSYILEKLNLEKLNGEKLKERQEKLKERQGFFCALILIFFVVGILVYVGFFYKNNTDVAMKKLGNQQIKDKKKINKYKKQ
jgi:hypothetical protein